MVYTEIFQRSSVIMTLHKKFYQKNSRVMIIIQVFSIFCTLKARF